MASNKFVDISKNKTAPSREKGVICTTRRLRTKMCAFIIALTVAFIPWVAEAQQCSGMTTLTSNSGTFSDGSGDNDYANNLDCSWLIEVASGRIIELNFSAFETEEIYDYVLVYDGNNASATLLGAFSGVTLPGELTSSSNRLFVEFMSDDISGAAGWTASYTSSESPLTLSTSALSAEAPSSTVAFDILSNTSWSITDDAAWISTDPNSGTNDQNVTVTIAENTSPFVARTGTITVTAGTIVRTLVITQNSVYTWTEATATAPWSARSRHTTAVYKNKLWVIGGYDGSRKNDVWSSPDGVTWTQATAAAPWSARLGHTTAVYDNKLWVIGGEIEGEDGSPLIKNDVWSSEDGVKWTEETTAANWSVRHSHTTAVYDNKLWVIGGDGGVAPPRLDSPKNDVWSSSDGVTWTQATANARWSVRYYHSTAVYDDKLWVIGGTDGASVENDVWSSEDGVKWTEATATPPWSARTDHATAVYDNKLWVIGGLDSSLLIKNDVWSSQDGVTWTEATATPLWSVRTAHSTAVYDNKLWVIGGEDFRSNKNDVWYYATPNTPSLALSITTLSAEAPLLPQLLSTSPPTLHGASPVMRLG